MILTLQSVLTKADVAKLVDALDLGSSAARHGGSSPSIRTTKIIYPLLDKCKHLSGLRVFRLHI